MGRPNDPLTPYRMRALKGGKDGSITYAVTYPGGMSVNGRRSSNIAFWGHLTEGLCFEPMLRFQLLPDSENVDPKIVFKQMKGQLQICFAG